MQMAKKIGNLLVQTGKHWLADNAQRMGAALAYYAMLALPPVLVILLFTVSLFYNAKDTNTQVANEINSLMGQKSGQFIQSLMADPQIHGKGTMATIIALVTIFVSATGVFAELQSDLNGVWGVEQKPNAGWWRMITNRLLAFLLLLIIGALLLVSLLASTTLTAAQKSVTSTVPGGAILWHVVEFVISCGIVTIFFAMIFKFLSDAKVHWRDAWAGGLVTAVLFTAGKLLLGLYLGSGSVASAYGVAGSIVLVLVWVYYSAQIFLFGAEFTQIYASQHGRSIRPAKQAIWKAEGEGAAEDREEANTSGKPEKTEWHAKPASGQETVQQLSKRVHSWPVLKRNSDRN